VSPRFTVATAAYPINPDFVARFVQGVGVATLGHERVRLVVAVEHGFDAAKALHRLPVGVTLELRPAQGSTSPAGLRRLMIESVRQSDSEIVVFCDFDDCLLPNALTLHAQALENVDVSFGPMILMNEKSEPLGREFPESGALPDEIEGPLALRSRNFMGFSNTAVRRAALAKANIAIPNNLAAVDWWFFTMLLVSGCQARRTAAPVANYRVYAQNTLGAGAADSIAMLRERAGIVGLHYAAISDVVNVTSEQAAVSRLLTQIENDPESVAKLVAQLPRTVGAWFDDVSAVCRMVETVA